jgi:hypothetical protein
MEDIGEAGAQRAIRLANRAVAILLLVVTFVSAGIDLGYAKGPMGIIGWGLWGANCAYFARYLLKSANGVPVSWAQVHYPPDDERRFFDNDQEWLMIVVGVAFSITSIWAIGSF